MLSLVRFADRLMADLAVAVTIDWLVSSVVHWSHGGGQRGGQDGGVSHGMVGHVGMGVEPDVSTGSGQDSRQAEESLQGVN